MTKKSLRMLALGFFLSGALVASLRYYSGEPLSDTNDEVEELQQEVASLEAQLAQFEVAQATAEQEQNEEEQAEEDPEDQEESNDEEESESEEDNGDSEEDSSDDPEESDEGEEDAEEESVEIISATITIGEGQPSSVAAQQLQEQGIIEDRFDFDEYLENNDFAVLVRPGSYEVSSDMDYEQIANTLMGR